MNIHQGVDVQRNCFPMATSESGQVQDRRQQERSHSPRPEGFIREEETSGPRRLPQQQRNWMTRDM